MICKSEKGEHRDKDHVRAERVHVCITAHGHVSAEEAGLFGPGPDRPARYPSYGQDE
jgi:hypothetical protein